MDMLADPTKTVKGNGCPGDAKCSAGSCSARTPPNSYLTIVLILCFANLPTVHKMGLQGEGKLVIYYSSSFLFFLNKFIYFGRVGSSLLHAGFL